jgi:hypothetical protein
MSTWPLWDRNQPESLVAYVQPDAVRRWLNDRGDSSDVRPPTSTFGSQGERIEALYECFAQADIRYSTEQLSPGRSDDVQWVRSPDQVLARSRQATCLDLAVTFAGGCLAAGLHPLVVLVDPVGGGVAHALVSVWRHGNVADSHFDAEQATASGLFGPGSPFVTIDITACTRTADFHTAVAAAEPYGDPTRWLVSAVVDVGSAFDDVTRHQVDDELGDPLRPGFLPLPPNARPLELIRAEYRQVPFQARQEFSEIATWVQQSSPFGGMKVVLLHGVGGAGKTRLVAEMADQLEQHGWMTGFLNRGANSSGVPDLA